MNLDPFDFNLPDANIALRPVEPRDACKLLVCQNDLAIEDRTFSDLVDILRPGDLLIANDTQVIPALLFGVRQKRDHVSQEVKIQVNLLEQDHRGFWKCLARPGKRLKEGDGLSFQNVLFAIIRKKELTGHILIEFSEKGEAFWDGLRKIGGMPIPPYIAKFRPSDENDDSDYQTVFARNEGSVAAPTAGLHFTNQLIEKLKSVNINLEYVTLHVGAGTFLGLSDEAFETGKLHQEWCEISPGIAQKISDTRAKGGRVIAVGTTALRTLEGRADTAGVLTAGSGPTDIFIQPGYEFRIVDGLITNFHLPRSSLFMLVSALMGTEKMQTAYTHAIKTGYRFYSYGDACLLIP